MVINWVQLLIGSAIGFTIASVIVRLSPFVASDNRRKPVEEFRVITSWGLLAIASISVLLATLVRMVTMQ